jgi:hypothetical protein
MTALQWRDDRSLRQSTSSFQTGEPMRVLALAAFAGLLVTASHADTMKNCAAAW